MTTIHFIPLLLPGAAAEDSRGEESTLRGEESVLRREESALRGEGSVLLRTSRGSIWAKAGMGCDVM